MKGRGSMNLFVHLWLSYCMQLLFRWIQSYTITICIINDTLICSLVMVINNVPLIR